MGPTAASSALLLIGQLANLSGFPTKTLRYYEEVGLLRPARRSESGYRLYDDAALRRLRFVRRAKGVGLSLADIKKILAISDEGRPPCEHVLAVIERELESVEAQLRRLHDMKRDLLGLKSRMVSAIAAGVASDQECPCFKDDVTQAF